MNMLSTRYLLIEDGFKRRSISTIQTLTSESPIPIVRPIWYQNVRSPIFMLNYEITLSEFWLSINDTSTDYPLTITVVYSLNT
jgi:hypothetical protein